MVLSFCDGYKTAAGGDSDGASWYVVLDVEAFAGLIAVVGDEGLKGY